MIFCPRDRSPKALNPQSMVFFFLSCPELRDIPPFSTRWCRRQAQRTAGLRCTRLRSPPAPPTPTYPWHPLHPPFPPRLGTPQDSLLGVSIPSTPARGAQVAAAARGQGQGPGHPWGPPPQPALSSPGLGVPLCCGGDRHPPPASPHPWALGLKSWGASLQKN